jgi:NAD-dependent deacetylase
MPTCPACGAILKPNVVLFGEELPANLLAQAQEAALTCELVVVAGASLEVMPTADLPLLAKRRGARLLLLNLGTTMLDERADMIIREDVTRSVPRLVEMCRQNC